MLNKDTDGDYNYKESNLVDDLAYTLYVKEVKQYDDWKDKVMYTQLGFVGSVGCEKYYKEAKYILRNIKIKNICHK